MGDPNCAFRRRQLCALMVFSLVPLLVSGCGGAVAEKGLVPVKGRVTLDGGPWPNPGQITFVPTAKTPEPGKPAVRSAVATFDKDGNFSVVGGYGGAEGLHPGKYWVAVDCPEGPVEMPLPGKPVQQKNAAPAKFRNPETSGLNLTVEAGKSPEANFDIKSK